MIEYLGLWLLIAVSLNMWAWLAVARSGRSLLVQFLWTLLLLVLPGIGFLAWFLIGPRSAHA